MTLQTKHNSRFWQRLRAPFAVSTVAVLLGAAVVAPMTLPGAEADIDPTLMQERLYQEFVPNADPANDLILPEIPIEKLPDPKPEPTPEPAQQAQPAAAPRYTGGGSPAEWMAAAGIAESDWGYVYDIINRESTWNPNAVNSSSGACGLGQALPCSKVPGNPFDPVDNLRWANVYANTCVPGRMYCGWAGAHAFWQANHWW